MDLQRFMRVLWRFRVVVLVGFLLALALATLSYVRVSLNSGGIKVSYRSPEIWQSRSTLLLTQQGFPWGRSVYPTPEVDRSGRPIITPGTPLFAGDTRFASLAVFYSEMANSDAVRALMQRGGPLRGTITAQPVPDQISGNALPFIILSGLGTSAKDAALAVRRGTTAFQDYLRSQQSANRIPENQRVVVQVIAKPDPPVVSVPRRKTRLVFIFVAIMAAAIALAFILENLRPQIRPVAVAPPLDAEAGRRSA